MVATFIVCVSVLIKGTTGLDFAVTEHGALAISEL